MRNTLLYSAAACLTTAVASTAAAQAVPFKEHQPFPDLVLPTLDDGSPASINDFRGSKVVLLIFASW